MLPLRETQGQHDKKLARVEKIKNKAAGSAAFWFGTKLQKLSLSSNRNAFGTS